eukprot:scaffold12693_cov142-Isochrysis_galbana.AAC.3
MWIGGSERSPAKIEHLHPPFPRARSAPYGNTYALHEEPRAAPDPLAGSRAGSLHTCSASVAAIATSSTFRGAVVKMVTGYAHRCHSGCSTMPQHPIGMELYLRSDVRPSSSL